MANIYDEVFSNPLIWETFGKYLSYRDFMELRLVSKEFLIKATASEGFAKRIYIKVYWNCFTPEQSQIMCPTFMSTPLPFVNLKFILMFEDNEVENYSFRSVSDYLSQLRGLKITILVQDAKVTEASRSERINIAAKALIDGSPLLVSLALNQEVLSKVELNQLSVRGQERLSYLRELVIYSPVTKKKDNEDLIQMILYGGGLPRPRPDDTERMKSNLGLLAGKTRKLRQIVVDKGSVPKVAVPYLATIFGNNYTTLSTLEVLNEDFWNHPGFNWQVHELPLLKRFKVKAKAEAGNGFAAFLSNNPLLEVLCLNFTDTFPIVVYNALATKCEKLRVLHVKSKCMGNPADWSFLSQAVLLEELEMKAPYSRTNPYFFPGTALANYHEIVGNLGQSLRKLHLRGLPGIGPLNVQSWNLPLLQELRILRCKGAFDDNVLRYLSTGQGYPVEFPFPRLVALEFSYCDGVTNFGITGMQKVGIGRRTRNTNFGFSLTNRSKLRQLTIKQCAQVTDGAMNRLGFPELRILDVSSNPKVTRAGIVNAVRQCPKLEVLRCSWRVGRDIESVVDDNRFIRLKFVDDKSGKEPNDSDSDADRQTYYQSDSDDNYYYESGSDDFD